MRYFFRVEYDGTRYSGWQNQPNAMSVQQLIEEALTVALRTPCGIVGAGRTDAGVHARSQGVHFDVPDDAAVNIERLTTSVNALLPYDIAVYGMTTVRDDFHARYSAVSRSYKYYFCDRKNPLNHKRVWPIYYKVDWERFNNETAAIHGVHDFTAFCSTGADSDNKICEVTKATLTAHDNGMRIFTISANRFIYKMVRSLVGTLIDISSGRLNDSMSSIIESKDRLRAGTTAPAHGLVLERVDYPNGFDVIK